MSQTTEFKSRSYDQCFAWGMDNTQLCVDASEKRLTNTHEINYLNKPTKINTTFLEGGEKISMLASGGSHTIFLTDKCNVYVIGRNHHGQVCCFDTL